MWFFCIFSALFRFDRDWKKIEDFVGSKTVIQVLMPPRYDVRNYLLIFDIKFCFYVYLWIIVSLNMCAYNIS